MRRNNIDKVIITGIITAAGLMLLMALIGVWKVASAQTNELSNSVIEKVSDVTKEISESDLTKYDGLVINGSEVINTYKKYLYEYESGQTGPITITIKNAGGTYSYVNGSDLDNLRDNTNSKYVKPTSKYKGSISRNTNGVITEVKFEIQ